jgi:hypothetical protein
MFRRVICGLAAALTLSACGLPSKERVAEDLQTIADAGAAPEQVTVEIRSLQRGEGDFSALEHIIDYDLKVWRSGQMIGPLVGGIAEARAGETWTGGRVTIVYARSDGPWHIAGIEVNRPASPPR